MISTRDAVELRRENLPERAGYVCILQQPDGRVLVKRFAARGRVVNVVDRYERGAETVKLDVAMANIIVHRLLMGVPWSDCFVIDSHNHAPMDWERSEAEHKFTSTGVKFWRHREAMESYKAGTGRSVISTHISPEGSCNLRCSFCSVTYRDTHSRIELSRIQKYVVDLQSRGLKAVILTGGGEPTLYPDFEKLVQWLKYERGLSVALITNGTTVSKVKADEFFEMLTWRAFSWVRVSINVFDGWKERIGVSKHLSENCVVGCSFVYSVEHEATTDEVPLSRVELFRQVGEVATKCGAKYVRVLPNCLLQQDRLVQEHHALKVDLETLGDHRFFQQYKVHAAPGADVCHQSYFRPYLSEEPFVEGGEPGTVYPCDSVVLNDGVARFADKWKICPPEKVLDFMDGKIEANFVPHADCSGCVFTSNVEMLGRYKVEGEEKFTDEVLVHEEFV